MPRRGPQFVKSLKPALRLSLPALETLAIIAYKQPVTAPEVNEIRGVDASGVFGSLLARKLIATAGRKQVIGRPILYKTTREFLLRFGLRDVSELPSMEEFEKMAASELDEPESAAEDESERKPNPAIGPEFDEAASEELEDVPAEEIEPGAESSEPTRTAATAESNEPSTPAEAVPAAPPLTEQAETENLPNDEEEKQTPSLNPPNPESAEPKLETVAPETEAAVEAEVEAAGIEDPIGDTTDGEAKTSVEADAAAEPEIAAEDSSVPEGSPEPQDSPEPESDSKPRPPAKLERLQKILAAAGVASRRSAEAMIEQGRVQVNGKVVTVLGTKADAGRDHIRVDGKLLQGAERLRYFVLNKPKGFVTTVKDPEGRPTVMQFFDKMKERLYPVGRLDYMSEGLLVVTNDGELANRLTKAASGVEKTYLVKVAGQPTEAELDILRGGVAIERGKARFGSGAHLAGPHSPGSPGRQSLVRSGSH